MRLKDIMSTNVESVRPGESLEKAERRMRRRGIHHLVVVKRGQMLGVVSAATLQTRIAEGVAHIQDAMLRHVQTATPDMTVAQAAQMMRGRPEGALPVFARRRLVGIITVSDLLDVLGHRHRRAPARRIRRAA